MNTKEAISHLRKIGWHVSKSGKKWIAHRIGYKEGAYVGYSGRVWGKEKPYTDRELVHLAKRFTHENRGESSIKKCMKSEEGAARAKARDEIKKGNDCDLPPRKTNRWDFD